MFVAQSRKVTEIFAALIVPFEFLKRVESWMEVIRIR